MVFGVSACGKSTTGTALANALGYGFRDGDDLHPDANTAKMSAGIPLTDADRWPWLSDIGAELATAPALVIACSALKRSYRDAIRRQAPDAFFVHLHGSDDVLHARVQGRQGHFMPASLLDSQLAALEPLDGDEAGLVLDVAQPVNELVARALAVLR